MGSINEYLNIILSAVYGKDVRQAIHDAIQQCYFDASTGITPDISVTNISGGHAVSITVGSDVQTFNVMDGTAVINPVIIFDTKTTAPTTKSEYTYASVPDLANYNVVLLACYTGNEVRFLTFCRQMGSIAQYLIDSKSVYSRGGFIVDWNNNQIGTRWVDGDTTTPATVYFTRCVGIG